jgi:hypothetical protein
MVTLYLGLRLNSRLGQRLRNGSGMAIHHLLLRRDCILNRRRGRTGGCLRDLPGRHLYHWCGSLGLLGPLDGNEAPFLATAQMDIDTDGSEVGC